MLSDDVIDQILNTFSEALGFYLLINEFLQLVVPEGFDLEDAPGRYPLRFGGLRVSYVLAPVVDAGSADDDYVVGTADTSSDVDEDFSIQCALGIVASTATCAGVSTCVAETAEGSNEVAETASAAGDEEGDFSIHRALGMVIHTATCAAPTHSHIEPAQMISTPSEVEQLDFRTTLQARVMKHLSPSFFSGKPGVLVRKGSNQFLTFPSRGAAQALGEANHQLDGNGMEVLCGDFKVHIL